MEQRLEVLDKSLVKEKDPSYVIVDSPLQTLLLQGKLRRAELEVHLYNRAIDERVKHQASLPEQGTGGLLWPLVVCLLIALQVVPGSNLEVAANSAERVCLATRRRRLLIPPMKIVWTMMMKINSSATYVVILSSLIPIFRVFRWKFVVIITPRLVFVDKEINCRGIGIKVELNLQEMRHVDHVRFIL